MQTEPSPTPQVAEASTDVVANRMDARVLIQEDRQEEHHANVSNPEDRGSLQDVLKCAQ